MPNPIGTGPSVATHKPMADAVFDHHLVPYLSTSLKQGRIELSKEQLDLRRRGGQSEVSKIFEEAHKTAELYYGLASLSACNRYYRDKLKGKKKELVDRIINLLTSFPEEPAYLFGGCDGQLRLNPIHMSVGDGNDLNALKIYFYYRPEALHVFATYFQTPLHQAVDNLSFRSMPFIAFLLELDKKLVKAGSHRSLLLVSDRVLCENLMLEKLVKASPKEICEFRDDHPDVSAFTKEQEQVKRILAKHACDLGIEDQLIAHAVNKAHAVVGDSHPDFRFEHVKEIRNLVESEKERITFRPATSVTITPPKKVETTTQKAGLTKKIEQVNEKTKSSWCRRIYQAMIYFVTCQWISNFIKFLKKTIQNR